MSLDNPKTCQSPKTPNTESELYSFNTFYCGFDIFFPFPVFFCRPTTVFSEKKSQEVTYKIKKWRTQIYIIGAYVIVQNVTWPGIGMSPLYIYNYVSFDNF